MDLLTQISTIDATELTDMTETKAGGQGARILPAGTAYVRPCMYIELGTQKQREFQGKAKDPAPMFVLGFRVVGGGGMNKEGKPERYVQEEGNFPLIKTYETPISLFEKSKAVGYHQALNRVGAKSTHFIQKLAEQPLYQLPIGVKIDEKTKKERQDIDFRALQPAFDAAAMQEVQAPTLKPEHIQAFLWDKPSKEQWDSIFIDGVWEAQKDESGKITKPAQSKNFWQERILGALNFEGSPIQKLLQSLGQDIAVQAPSLEAPAIPAAPVAPAAPAAPVAPPAAPSVPEVPLAPVAPPAPPVAPEVPVAPSVPEVPAATAAPVVNGIEVPQL